MSNSSSNNNNIQPRACIIGAGPSGLVAAKYLRSRLFQVTIFESSNDIGGTFRNKVYDKARLVSSKFLTAFSDYRMPAHYPNHPTAEQFVDYLENFCTEFQLRDSIQFQREIVSIQDVDTVDELQKDSKGYWVEYRKLDSDKNELHKEHFDVVLVCSGLHNVPNIPEIPNRNAFSGTVIHSSTYQDASLFDNKRVLILGSGETAMDLALQAVENPSSKDVAICVRRGFLSIPHNLAEDRPLDVFITNLFEHSYEHPWVNKLRLRWWLSTVVIRGFLFASGSSVGFNQWACPIEPTKRGYHIINKSAAAMKHMNVPIKEKTFIGRFWMWFYGEKGLRPIQSFHKTAVERVDDNGTTIHFTDGQKFDADVIVLATGYKQSFPFLSEQIKQDHCNHSLLSSKDFRHAEEEDILPSEHFVVSKIRPRLGFIGFVRPNVGAIPPMSELQVMWWLSNLDGNVERVEPDKVPSYMVLGRKYQYGVDYGNYMHRLAEDMGAAPTLRRLLQSPRPLIALYTYCQGQSHIPLFRLQGPFASDICEKVTIEELWDVCKRRGWAENIGLASVTYVSLWMNLSACVLEALWGVVTLRRPRFFARYG